MGGGGSMGSSVGGWKVGAWARARKSNARIAEMIVVLVVMMA